MGSTDISLPKDCVPKFPEWCIVCGEQPDSSIKISYQRTFVILELIFPILMFFGWSRISIPICKKCKWKFILQRWSRWIAILVVLTVTIFVVKPFFSDVNESTKKFYVVGAGVLAVIPILVFDAIWPKYIHITGNRKSLQYEFKRPGYAYMFRALNEEDIVKVE